AVLASIALLAPTRTAASPPPEFAGLWQLDVRESDTLQQKLETMRGSGSGGGFPGGGGWHGGTGGGWPGGMGGHHGGYGGMRGGGRRKENAGEGAQRSRREASPPAAAGGPRRPAAAGAQARLQPLRGRRCGAGSAFGRGHSGSGARPQGFEPAVGSWGHAPID